MIKISQGTEHVGWDHPLSTFIVGIGSLRYIDGSTYLSLCKVMILA